jgi:hypothetical protein
MRAARADPEGRHAVIMRQYSAKTFFRNTPNEFLRQYFQRAGIDLDLEWRRLHETDVVHVFTAMERQPEALRSASDRDFRLINDLACEKGIQSILQHAAFTNGDWSKQFAAMGSHYERAMWTFLHEPTVFRIAGTFHEMDRRAAWRRRFVGQRLEIRTDEKASAVFKKRLQLFFRNQGRGRFCHIDYYVRSDPERHCFFAYPEDYASTELGFDDNGRFLQRSRRPAFEIIFVYRPEEGVLELSGRGRKEQIEQLMRIFCTTILNLVDLPADDGLAPFDLEVLKDRTFPFPTDPADRVAAVNLRMLRFELPPPGGRRITVAATTNSCGPRTLHDLVDAAIDSARLPLTKLQVSQAKLQLVFAPADDERPRSLTFEVTYPDRCTLKDDPCDQVAKKYLRRWGIAS